MKNFLIQYGGIILASIYGLIMRILFGRDDYNFAFEDLFSFTFVCVVPVVLGIIPLMFADDEQLNSATYIVSGPVSSVLLCFLAMFWAHIEDILCLLVMSIPFLAAAVIGGVLFSFLMKYIRKKKGTMYTLLLLPFFSGLIEGRFEVPVKAYHVRSEVLINASAPQIWQNVVRVRQIDETEYKRGFFNYAGIPRPLYAELSEDTIGARRTGYFEGGLIFRETVTEWERNRKVSFDIVVLDSSVRNRIFDQHVLKGKHFRFLNASYELIPVNNGQTKVVLSSSYELRTGINAYSSVWGELLLEDFQERLLNVIKKRCEKNTKR